MCFTFFAASVMKSWTPSALLAEFAFGFRWPLRPFLRALAVEFMPCKGWFMTTLIPMVTSVLESTFALRALAKAIPIHEPIIHVTLCPHIHLSSAPSWDTVWDVRGRLIVADEEKAGGHDVTGKGTVFLLRRDPHSPARVVLLWSGRSPVNAFYILLFHYYKRKMP